MPVASRFPSAFTINATTAETNSINPDMHDPETLIFSLGPFTLWHRDPCSDHSDDSCGWFMRARHGDKTVLKRITSGIALDWKHYFSETGDPLMSTPGIVINMFWWGAHEALGKKARKWMRDNLDDILMFAENPIDGLHSGITGKYGEDREPKEHRIAQFAQCIYGWILRSKRTWWKHPRFHFHHWRISCRPFWRKATR